MGLTDSPYLYLQLLIYVKFISYGDRKDTLNPFQWIQDKLNMPVDESYTPKLHWVTKVRSDGHLVSEVFIYVDDGRIIAHLELVCWQAAKRFFFNLQLTRNSGHIQEADRTFPQSVPLFGNSGTHI